MLALVGHAAVVGVVEQQAVVVVLSRRCWPMPAYQVVIVPLMDKDEAGVRKGLIQTQQGGFVETRCPG